MPYLRFDEFRSRFNVCAILARACLDSCNGLFSTSTHYLLCQARNPKTGEKMIVQAATVPAFSFGTRFAIVHDMSPLVTCSPFDTYQRLHRSASC